MSVINTWSFDASSDGSAYFQEPGDFSQVVQNTGESRTGIGAFANAGSPSTYLLPNPVQELVMGFAINTSIQGATFTPLLGMSNLAGGALSCIQLGLNLENKFCFQTIPTAIIPIYLISTNVIYTAGIYDYIEWDVTASDGAGGNITFRYNGFPVKNCWTLDRPSADGSDVTVRNVVTCNGPIVELDQVSVRGGGSGNVNLFDDGYVNETLIPPNQSFLGPIENYELGPIADGNPLEFTPSTGTSHWNLVNQIGVVNDARNVFALNIGNEDEYVFSASGVPANASWFAIKASMRAFLNQAGARGLSLCARGPSGQFVGPLNPLSTGGKWYIQVYNTDPITNAPIGPNTITANQFGEIITG